MALGVFERVRWRDREGTPKTTKRREHHRNDNTETEGVLLEKAKIKDHEKNQNQQENQNRATTESKFTGTAAQK